MTRLPYNLSEILTVFLHLQNSPQLPYCFLLGLGAEEALEKYPLILCRARQKENAHKRSHIRRLQAVHF